MRARPPVARFISRTEQHEHFCVRRAPASRAISVKPLLLRIPRRPRLHAGLPLLLRAPLRVSLRPTPFPTLATPLLHLVPVGLRLSRGSPAASDLQRRLRPILAAPAVQRAPPLRPLAPGRSMVHLRHPPVSAAPPLLPAQLRNAPPSSCFSALPSLIAQRRGRNVKRYGEWGRSVGSKKKKRQIVMGPAQGIENGQR